MTGKLSRFTAQSNEASALVQSRRNADGRGGVHARACGSMMQFYRATDSSRFVVLDHCKSRQNKLCTNTCSSFRQIRRLGRCLPRNVAAACKSRRLECVPARPTRSDPTDEVMVDHRNSSNSFVAVAHVISGLLEDPSTSLRSAQVQSAIKL